MKVLELKNIGKRFPLFDRTDNSLPFLWAIKNINMTMHKEEIIGIIGRNGSGKSTLLRVIDGIFPPSEGAIKIEGKVSSVFTLGAGFQDQLTGRENIYLNGSILKMNNAAIKRRYQDILNFSELHNFIDMPLGSYSEGMRMRLGFSIAIHTDFDILLIDEALVVGDISFQKKCFEALLNYKQKGKMMILATQALDIVERLCDRVFLLENGRLVFSGATPETIQRYRKLLNAREFSQRKVSRVTRSTKRWAEDMQYWGQRQTSAELIIKSVQIVNGWKKKTHTFKPQDKMEIKINFQVYRQVQDIHFGVALFREDGVYCYGPNSRWDGYGIDLYPGKGWVVLEYNELFLAPGIYYFSVAIWQKEESFAYAYDQGCYKIEIKGRNHDGRLLKLPVKWHPFVWPWQRLFFCNNSLAIKELQNREEEILEKDGLDIVKVAFLDEDRTQKKEFSTGQKMCAKIVFALDPKYLAQSKKGLSLWVGIFRSDGIYCQGHFQKVSVNDKNREIVLVFPRLWLLPGEYRVSVGFGDNASQEFLAYHHKLYPFKVIFTKKDHGTVYLRHKWRWNLPKVKK